MGWQMTLRKMVFLGTLLMCGILLFSDLNYAVAELIEGSSIPYSWNEQTESQRDTLFFVNASLYIVLGISILVLILGFVRPFFQIQWTPYRKDHFQSYGSLRTKTQNLQ